MRIVTTRLYIYSIRLFSMILKKNSSRNIHLQVQNNYKILTKYFPNLCVQEKETDI